MKSVIAGDCFRSCSKWETAGGVMCNPRAAAARLPVGDVAAEARSASREAGT